MTSTTLVRRRQQEYGTLLQRLQTEGFQVEPTSPSVPLQLAGQLPSGELFYFRCRGTSCRLAIAPPQGNPVLSPSWEETLDEWDWPQAGMLSALETEGVFRQVLRRYHQSPTSTLSRHHPANAVAPPPVRSYGRFSTPRHLPFAPVSLTAV